MLIERPEWVWGNARWLSRQWNKRRRLALDCCVCFAYISKCSDTNIQLVTKNRKAFVIATKRTIHLEREKIERKICKKQNDILFSLSLSGNECFRSNKIYSQMNVNTNCVCIWPEISYSWNFYTSSKLFLLYSLTTRGKREYFICIPYVHQNIAMFRCGWLSYEQKIL